MNRLGRAAVMLMLGLTMGRLLWTGSFGWFVQQRMQIPLLVATIVLLGLGLYEGIAGSREEVFDETASRLSRAPKVGWLMVLPLLVLVSVAPTGLGAAAADRVEAFTPTETSVTYAALDTSRQPIEMRVFDFLDRSIWDPDRSTEGLVVRLEGLVVNDPEITDGFLLTRFMVSCCAADGVPLQVMVRGVETAYPDDTWVVVDVQWNPPEVPYMEQPLGAWFVEADLVSLSVDPNPPSDAYESPYGD